MNIKQFKVNIGRINRAINKKYPGAKLIWPVDGNPEIHIQENQIDQQEEIIVSVQKQIRKYGGDAEFYPEKAYKID